MWCLNTCARGSRFGPNFGIPGLKIETWGTQSSAQEFGGFLGEVGDGEVGAGAANAHQRFENSAIVVEPAFLEGGLEHGVLARDLVGTDGDSAAIFACLLIGQPTLRRRLKLGQLAALDQRIAVRYHMNGMTLEETSSYLRHHLALSGRSDTLFSDDAAALIHQTSRGYPRAVNNIAVAALLAAFTAGKAIVDESSARAAVTEVTTE